jgi:Uma2 family endonuclease
MESWPRRHHITADEYHRMAEVGLLAPDARVELIEGEIIETAPIGQDHSSVLDQLNRLFIRRPQSMEVAALPGFAKIDLSGIFAA